MSKLIMWNLLTLDGYFEGAKNWATVPDLKQRGDRNMFVFGRADLPTHG